MSQQRPLNLDDVALNRFSTDTDLDISDLFAHVPIDYAYPPPILNHSKPPILGSNITEASWTDPSTLLCEDEGASSIPNHSDSLALGSKFGEASLATFDTHLSEHVEDLVLDLPIPEASPRCPTSIDNSPELLQSIPTT